MNYNLELSVMKVNYSVESSVFSYNIGQEQVLCLDVQ